MKKLILLFFALCALILITFGIFGDTFDQWFSSEKSKELFLTYGVLAGPIGAGLLISDLILPIPTTIIIGAMGATMGVTQGALWGWLGLSLAGLSGYGVARLGGQRWADKLASPEEQIRTRALFDTWGGLAVILSRMLPILPEAISVLAGLYGMKFSRFLISVTLGSLPPALAFSWLGHQAKTHPGPALWGMVGVTAVAWLAYIACAKKQTK